MWYGCWTLTRGPVASLVVGHPDLGSIWQWGLTNCSRCEIGSLGGSQKVDNKAAVAAAGGRGKWAGGKLNDKSATRPAS